MEIKLTSDGLMLLPPLKTNVNMKEARLLCRRPLEPYHYFFGIGEFKDGSEALF